MSSSACKHGNHKHKHRERNGTRRGGRENTVNNTATDYGMVIGPRDVKDWGKARLFGLFG